MDENNKYNPANEPETDSVDSTKRVDDFFKKLEQNGVLEDSVTAKKRDGYDPDYINLGEYEKSDTGFVSLKQKSGEVETFNSATSGAKVGGADSKDIKKAKLTTKSGKTGPKAGKSGKGKKGTDDDYKPQRKGWRVVGRLALFVVCIGIIAACVVAVAAAMYLAKATADDDEALDLNSLELSYATRLMAMDQETGDWFEYERIFGGENRVWVSYDEFPDELIRAAVSSEDQRFWDHKGVDLKRTIGAFINEYVVQIWSNTQGGSTIDQQLIKNITNEKSVGGMEGALRKMREIYRAYMLERHYSKEQILEAYLNTFRLGGQVAGIESAANYYFAKSTSELTLAESAAIVCITKYPTAYDPYLNPDENKYQRENVVLWGMHERKEITDQEYQDALAESEHMVFTKGDTVQSATHVYSYFTDTAVREVIKDLQEINGMTSAEANDAFYGYSELEYEKDENGEYVLDENGEKIETGNIFNGGGGLTVYLTIDTKIQEAVEDVAFNPIYWDTETYGPVNGRNPETREYNDVIWPALEYEDVKDENGEYVLDADGKRTQQLAKNQVQAAMVVMNYEGELLGVAGGIREKEGSLNQNRAVDSKRQTGSSMKPIADYAPALELDKITYSTVFADAPSETIGGQPWPRNYSRTYGAAVTVYDGLRQSLNTTAVHVMKLIGPDYSFDFLTTSLGITSLVEDKGDGVSDRTLSLALGGLTEGISPYEMAAAYQVFGNDGTYTTPHCYTRVIDSRGAVVINKEQNIQTIKALSDDTAMIMNRLLQGVAKAGTGTAMMRNSKLPIAAKTGTTSDNYDFWAIGMNPYYVMAVWEGYDEPDYMYTYRPHPTQQAFNLVMNKISEGLEYKSFPVADDVIQASYCTATGRLASGACPSVATGFYKKDNVPGYCSHEFVPTEEEQAAAAAAAAG